jgi:carboxymethylenebutenolidase
MCFDHDSRPPIPPIAGGALDAREVELEAADGNRFAAYAARAAEPIGAGIVILPDVRGLHAYYRELALRFAENGVDAIAIDYFGRTAGIGDRGPGFDWAAHVPKTTYEGIRADTTAAAAHLRDVTGATNLFSVGFCMGGRNAFLSAGFGLGLAGDIGFYGWPVGPSRNGTPAPADVAATLASPVLAIFGGADEGIGPAAIADFEAALAAAGVEHQSGHPGAPTASSTARPGVRRGVGNAWDRCFAFSAATGRPPDRVPRALDPPRSGQRSPDHAPRRRLGHARRPGASGAAGALVGGIGRRRYRALRGGVRSPTSPAVRHRSDSGPGPAPRPLRWGSHPTMEGTMKERLIGDDQLLVTADTTLGDALWDWVAADAARRAPDGWRIANIGAVGTQFSGAAPNMPYGSGGGFMTGVAMWILYRR